MSRQIIVKFPSNLPSFIQIHSFMVLELLTYEWSVGPIDGRNSSIGAQQGCKRA